MAEKEPKKFAAGLLVGGVAGLIAGLLLAPQPGRETRQIVRERSGKYLGAARERGESYLGSARDRVRNLRRSRRQEPETADQAEAVEETEEK